MRATTRLYILCLAVCLSLNLLGQSKEVQARANFLKAEELYGNGAFQESIERLRTVKELLGQTNPRVEYLLAHCHFQNQDVAETDAAIKAYFAVARESDANYTAMLMLIENLRENKTAWEKAALRVEQEDADWAQAKSTNTTLAYDAFLRKYPKTQYLKDAELRMAELPPLPFTDPRDGTVYTTIWFEGKLWMAENMRLQTEKSSCHKECETYGFQYIYDEAKAVCPDGWRLPTVNELTLYHMELGLPRAGWNQRGKIGQVYFEKGAYYWAADKKRVGGGSGFFPMDIGYTRAEQNLRYSCRCIKD